MNLSDLDVGDKVAVPRRWTSLCDIHTVTRSTASQLIAGGLRIRKADGLVLGHSDTWSRTYARHVTAEDVLALRMRSAQDRLQGFVVTAENVAAVEALLQRRNVA